MADHCYEGLGRVVVSEIVVRTSQLGDFLLKTYIARISPTDVCDV